MWKRFRPSPEFRPVTTIPSGDTVRVRWLGTAGHVIQASGITLLVDPFLTRPSLLRTAALPLRPTPEAWWPWLPHHIDAILVGHSHYDHLLDAPVIAQRTGARLAGSRTTASFARASGVPEDRIHEVPSEGGEVSVGPLRIRFIHSLHGRIAAGRVPFDGEVRKPPELPARLWDYRMGGAFGVHVEGPGWSLYHNGSADLIDTELEGLRADVVLAGLAGRQATPGYLERLVTALQPNLVVPTHHDFFFRPLDAGPQLLPGIDMEGFVTEMRRLRPGTGIRMPTYEDVLHIPCDGARAGHAAVSPF